MLQKTKTDLQRQHPRKHAAHVVIQSMIGAVFLLVVHLISDFFGSGLVAASIGASTFITFAFPQAESSRPRYLIGGYVTAVLFGCLACWGLAATGATATSFPLHAVFCALAALGTILCMVAFDLQHPPSVALAISMVGIARPVTLGLFTIACIVVLCLLKRLLRRYLVNL